MSIGHVNIWTKLEDDKITANTGRNQKFHANGNKAKKTIDLYMHVYLTSH